MEITAKRTLVKSPPELWELLDDEGQLRHWSARLCKGGSDVEVVAREPGRRLAWRSNGIRTATIEVELSEKGFGTQVSIWAVADEGLRRNAFEQVLEDLASPQRRPFSAV